MMLSRHKTWMIIFAIFTVVCTTAVLVFHSLYSDMSREIAVTKSTAAVESVREKFLEIAKPIIRDLKLLSQWGTSGFIVMNDVPSLNGRFIPLLKSQSLVSSLILADIDGREYFLLKEKNAWMARHAGPYDPKIPAAVDRMESDGQIRETTRTERPFDPRTRSWFAGALQSDPMGSVDWTEPYTFKTLGKLGITASVKWQGDKGRGPITVAAMDVTMDTLRHFLESIQITPGSQIMLIRNDGMMMAPAKAGKKDKHSGFITADDLPDSLKKDALSLWTDLKGHPMTTRSLTSRGRRWWVSFQPLQPESPKTWIGVLIPESDLEGFMGWWWVSYILVFGVSMALLALVSGVILKRYARRFSGEPGHGIIDEAALKAMIEAGEGPTVEFKSTVRVNLKSGQKDKIIELAWLKGVTAFMNSEGGTLLVGVGDNGDILGIAADDFENKDKCHLHIKNLIHEHIGSEFAGFIQCYLQDIDGKTLVCLTCRKADVPIFLKTGKNEDFYIRSGPSSTKLTMSQMVAYLDHRK